MTDTTTVSGGASEISYRRLCPDCGRSISLGASFCKYCGCSLSGPTDDSDTDRD